MDNLIQWATTHFGVSTEELLAALKMSPSSQWYIHGAISEFFLMNLLTKKGFEVYRIKEKPSGGFDKKKVGYKGDFLIRKVDLDKYYVVECKGLKTNSEFRSTKTNKYQKNLTKKNAFDALKKFINIDKEKIYNNGYKKYLAEKNYWESKNPRKNFPWI